MKDFIRKINKYIILMIISSLFGMPWFYVKFLLFEPQMHTEFSLVESIPTFVDYAIRLIVIILLVIDFRKEDLKNVVLTCIAALFFPLLGVVIFSILLIEKNRQKASA
jgi:hypothetical protein